MTAPPGITRAQTWALAVACALSVANLYYIQPLLADVARSLDVSVTSVGMVPMLTQVGYALGLFFVVPLGDALERRSLVVKMLLAVSVALVATALAPSLALLGVASVAVGVTTITPQLLIPLAATLARPEERGRVVGTVMGGLLVGVLAARTVSGLVNGWLGWRAMYWMAAALMLLLAGAARLLLPRSPPQASLPYGELLRSLPALLREEPILRDAALLGALAFAGFSAFWTTLIFRLEAAPYHYGSAAAGLFGLIGVGGALAAPMVGRLADSRSPRFTAALGLAAAFVSFLLFWAFSSVLVGLIVGVLLLDLGIQSNQISNQTRIYALRPEARSRLNTVYMVAYFAGGAAGSYAGALAFSHAGWPGVCGMGLALTGAALGVIALGRERARAAAA